MSIDIITIVLKLIVKVKKGENRDDPNSVETIIVNKKSGKVKIEITTNVLKSIAKSHLNLA